MDSKDINDYNIKLDGFMWTVRKGIKLQIMPMRTKYHMSKKDQKTLNKIKSICI